GVWSTVSAVRIGSSDSEGGLGNGESSVVIDDVVVAEVGARCQRNDSVGTNRRGRDGDRVFGEGEGIAVYCASRTSREDWVCCAVCSAGVRGGNCESGL